MCGITGILRFDNELIKIQHIKNMTDAIVHRGPDDEGQWVSKSKNIGLGHRRLSIIDLSKNARQPMHYLNRFSIVYNGEIYNYLELKATLKLKNYHFSSRSDTEVLLALYAEKGKKMLQDLDGMFAFAIWDSLKKELFCARDRFGEKPFFYYKDKNVFVFASEMKALWAYGIPKSVKEDRIQSYVETGSIESENSKNETYFYNINSLDSASLLSIKLDGNIDVSEYWNLDSIKTNTNISFNEAKNKYFELFKQSVKNRLRSDVSVGSSLSGGIDSSSIVMLIDQLKLKGQTQKVFSARFKDFEKDEGVYIDEILNNCNNLKGYNVWPEKYKILDFIEKVVFHQEEPFGSSSILAQWKVMEIAKDKNVTVLLDGQGADEYLAGYLPDYKSFLTQLFFENRAEYDIQFLRCQDLNTFQGSIPHYLNTETFRMKIGRYKKQFFNQKIQYEKLKDRLKYKLTSSGLKDLLRYADRNSMAFSREVRLPFLNHKLIEFIFSLPDDFLLKDGWTKYIHRKSFDKILPNKICWRKDKIGYEPPQQRWLNDENIKEIILSQKNRFKISDTQLSKGSYTNNMEWKLFIASFFK
jgi:asparagine synthase (glutamine-hydrolysing)